MATQKSLKNQISFILKTKNSLSRMVLTYAELYAQCSLITCRYFTSHKRWLDLPIIILGQHNKKNQNS